MDKSDDAREKLLYELEEAEWDLSEETLGNVTKKIRHFFSSDVEAKDFVEENASYLFKAIEEEYGDC